MFGVWCRAGAALYEAEQVQYHDAEQVQHGVVWHGMVQSGVIVQKNQHMLCGECLGEIVSA